MAKTNPITTACAKVTNMTNTTYSNGNSITFPFEANRVTVIISSVTGNDDLILSLDGVNDSAMMHHTAQGTDVFTFELQKIKQLWYKTNGSSTFTFIVNAEMQAWPNMF